jgi:hypothetical protein
LQEYREISDAYASGGTTAMVGPTPIDASAVIQLPGARPSASCRQIPLMSSRRRSGSAGAGNQASRGRGGR